MDLALPAEVQAQLQGVEDLLGRLEAKLQPFLGPSAKSSLAQLEPLERAQAQLAVAHAAHRMLQLFLQSFGVDPASHESRKEQDRLQQYDKKVRRAVAERVLSQSKRSLEVNVSAVNRFITAAVPDLSQQQKAALKVAGQKRKAAGEGGRDGAAGEGSEKGQQQEQGEAADAAAAFLQETMAELHQGQAQQAQQQEGGSAAGGPPGGSGKKRKKGKGKQ